jgi:Fe2+ transport system protein FeoA
MANGGMPLAMAGPGKLLTVTGINAGWGLQRRLADMGLTPGVQIKVMNGRCGGPVLIDLRGSRLGLGRGVAQRILVKEAGDGKKGDNSSSGR